MSVQTSASEPTASPMQSAPRSIDSGFAELVHQYLSAMPTRVEQLNSAFANGDWGQLNRSVHQLKGSAGSYGFPAISAQAACLERLIAELSTGAEVTAALTDLIALCEKAQLRQNNH